MSALYLEVRILNCFLQAAKNCARAKEERSQSAILKRAMPAEESTKILIAGLLRVRCLRQSKISRQCSNPFDEHSMLKLCHQEKIHFRTYVLVMTKYNQARICDVATVQIMRMSLPKVSKLSFP